MDGGCKLQLVDRWPQTHLFICVDGTQRSSRCSVCIRLRNDDKKAVLESAGLMDERYFLYFEDADYCEKVKANGWRIVFLPNATLYHAVSSTTGFQSKNYVYYFSRNRLWFLKRWAPRVAYIYYLLFTVLVKLPGAVIIFALLRQKPSLCNAFFKGFIDAFRKPKRHAQ